MSLNIGMKRSKKYPRYSYHAPIPKSTFTTYMDEGLMHFRSGFYRKALYCYDRAIELKPTHKGALVARSSCYLKLGDAGSALRDAEFAFNSDNETVIIFIRGLVQYAESLFALSLFEKALIQFHIGYRLRRDMEVFRIGIQKCQQSIKQAILNHSGTQIEDLDDVLPLIKSIQALDNPRNDHCCVRPDSRDIDKNAPLKPISKTRSRWVAREVLGSMFSDMEYLKSFLRRPDIKTEQGYSPILRNNASEALNYLKIREQFWRQQLPMYSRKFGLNFNNEIVLHYEQLERDRQEQSRKIKMDAANGAVLKNISLIEHALEINRPKDCQLECDRTLRQMKEMSLILLPNKNELMCKVLQYKGLAYMKMKQWDEAIETFTKEFDIGTQLRDNEIKGRSLDYLGKTYALKGSFSEAAEAWEGRIMFTKIPLERAYLFHEIGRCNYEMNKYEIAKYYAGSSFDEAIKIDDWIWAMNAKILLGQTELKAGNYENAQYAFEMGEEYAEKCGNQGNASLMEEALQCLKVYVDKLAAQEAEELLKTQTEDDENQTNEQNSITPLQK